MTRSDGAQSSSRDTKQKMTKQLLERIKEATGADEEVITHTLEQCNYDPNEATARLIESKNMAAFKSVCRKRALHICNSLGALCRPVFGVCVQEQKEAAGTSCRYASPAHRVNARARTAAFASQRAAESAKDPRIVEVKRAGSTSNSTRGGRGYGRGDRQNGERSRSVRGERDSSESMHRCYRLPGFTQVTSLKATISTQALPVLSQRPSQWLMRAAQVLQTAGMIQRLPLYQLHPLLGTLHFTSNSKACSVGNKRTAGPASSSKAHGATFQSVLVY